MPCVPCHAILYLSPIQSLLLNADLFMSCMYVHKACLLTTTFAAVAMMCYVPVAVSQFVHVSDAVVQESSA